MPNYDFNKDLVVAKKTEQEIAGIIRERYNAVILEYGRTNAYDIKARINDKIFTFEIKEDFTCRKTGNVGVEYECRGKPSGIEVSKADFYIYKIHTAKGIEVYIFKTQAIKDMIKRVDYKRIVNGGDVGSNSMNYLFKYDVFVSHGKKIFPL